MPKPGQNESQSDFVSRCIPIVLDDGTAEDQDQAVAICNSIFRQNRNFNMPSINDQLLAAIRNRKSKSEPFNGGILIADSYVKTLQDCIGSDLCYRFAAKGHTSFEDTLKKAAKTLTYNNSDMVLEDKYGELTTRLKDHEGNEIEKPKNTLMLFRHVLTTPKKDRDGDILRTQGATTDPNMLLLYQHVHTLPIGKALGIAKHTSEVLSMFSAIVDMNELSHDAAVMVDNKMGRFSHGFKADEFEEIEDEEDNNFFIGFNITKFSIMEESLVSIPSNTDAETEEIMLSLIEGGKLTSDLMKEVGISIREKRPVSSTVKYKERFGDHERMIETSNVADFETVFKRSNNENQPGSGSTETKGKGKGCSCNTSKETNGSEKKKGISKAEEVEYEIVSMGMEEKSFMGRTGTQRGHDHSVFVDDEGHGETSVVDGHSHQIHNWEVGSEGDHIHTLDRGSLSRISFEEIDAKQAMAVFLVKSTKEQRQQMIQMLQAFEESDERSALTEEYNELLS